MDYSVHVTVQNVVESTYVNQFTFMFRVVETKLFQHEDNTHVSVERIKASEFVQPLATLVPPFSSLIYKVDNMLSRLEPFEQDPTILSVPLSQETRLYLSDSDQTVPYNAVVYKICEAATLAVTSDPTYLGAVVTIEKRIVMEESSVIVRSFEDAQVVRAAPAMKSAVKGLERRLVSDEDFYCTICLEDASEGRRVEVTVMPCSQPHMFHSHCILEWLSQNHSCPLCRFKLPHEE